MSPPSPLPGPSAPRTDALSVAHLVKDVERRAVRGGAVTLIAQGLRMALQLGSTAVLARLLTPKDYGIFGMAVVYTGLASLINDLGLNTATVQKTDITQGQVSALFWLNTAFSLLCTVVVAGSAPLIAWLWNEPALTPMVATLSLSLLLSGIAAQHGAVMTRQMRFGAIAAIEVLSFVGGIAAAIACGLGGLRSWALVAMYTVQPLLRSGAILLVAGWRPDRPRMVEGVRGLMTFGGHLTTTRVLGYITRNLDNALIGWYWGPAALGVYSRAFALFMSPLSALVPAVRQVVEPTLSRVQDDRARHDQIYRQFEELLAWLTMPLSAIVVVAAKPIVRLALGPGWEETALVLQVMSIAAPILPLLTSVGWLFVTSGRTRQLLNWSVISAVVHVVAFFAAVAFGNTAMAAAVGLARVVVTTIGMKMARADADLGLLVLLRELASPIATSLIAALLAAVVLSRLSGTSAIVQVCVATGMIAGGSLLVLTATGRLRRLLDLLRRRVPEPAAGR